MSISIYHRLSPPLAARSRCKCHIAPHPTGFCSTIFPLCFLHRQRGEKRREGGKLRSNYGGVTMQTPEEIHSLSLSLSLARAAELALFLPGQYFKLAKRSQPRYKIRRINPYFKPGKRIFSKQCLTKRFLSLSESRVDVGTPRARAKIFAARGLSRFDLRTNSPIPSRY